MINNYVPFFFFQLFIVMYVKYIYWKIINLEVNLIFFFNIILHNKSINQSVVNFLYSFIKFTSFHLKEKSFDYFFIIVIFVLRKDGEIYLRFL